MRRLCELLYTLESKRHTARIQALKSGGLADGCLLSIRRIFLSGKLFSPEERAAAEWASRRSRHRQRARCELSRRSLQRPGGERLRDLVGVARYGHFQ